jgi:SAM-dependent methyltransferase
MDQLELKKAFTSKYESDDQDWERNSGPGSEPFYTIPYRAFLEQFLRLNGIGTVLDIGCGDWQFSRFVNFSGVQYLGLDIVESVVAGNQARFARPNVRFALAPADIRDLPQADLLIMKDVLQHLPDAEIMRYRDEVFPRFRYCLITNSFRKAGAGMNHDVPPGGFRCLDLSAAPYEIAGANVLQFPSAHYEELRTLLIVNR